MAFRTLLYSNWLSRSLSWAHHACSSPDSTGWCAKALCILRLFTLRLSHGLQIRSRYSICFNLVYSVLWHVWGLLKKSQIKQWLGHLEKGLFPPNIKKTLILIFKSVLQMLNCKQQKKRIQLHFHLARRPNPPPTTLSVTLCPEMPSSQSESPTPLPVPVLPFHWEKVS